MPSLSKIELLWVLEGGEQGQGGVHEVRKGRAAQHVEGLADQA